MTSPLILYHTVRPQTMFKITDRLKSFGVQYQGERKIIVQQYEFKKLTKSLNQQKKLPDTYQLITLQDQQLLFFKIKQININKPSVYTMAEQGFFETPFSQSVFGDRTLKSSNSYQISRYRWDSIVFEFIPFSEHNHFFLISNEMMVPLFKNLNLETIISKFNKAFQQILQKLIVDNAARMNTFVAAYVQQIKKIIDQHPQIVKQVAKDPNANQVKKQTQKIINFNFIKYGKIIEISKKDTQQRSQQIDRHQPDTKVPSEISQEDYHQRQGMDVQK